MIDLGTCVDVHFVCFLFREVPSSCHQDGTPVRMWSWGRGAAAGGGSGRLLVGPEAARQAACGSLTSPSAPGMIRSPVGGGTMFPTGKTLARSEVLLKDNR